MACGCVAGSGVLWGALKGAGTFGGSMEGASRKNDGYSSSGEGSTGWAVDRGAEGRSVVFQESYIACPGLDRASSIVFQAI